MVKLDCQFPNCVFSVENESENAALAMFNSHTLSHQPTPAAAPQAVRSKLPPVLRPEVKQDINDEDWATFVAEWNHFKRCAEVPATQLADQLFLCCEKNLGRLLLKENSTVIASGETELLKAMKRIWCGG